MQRAVLLLLCGSTAAMILFRLGDHPRSGWLAGPPEAGESPQALVEVIRLEVGEQYTAIGAMLPLRPIRRSWASSR